MKKRKIEYLLLLIIFLLFLFSDSLDYFTIKSNQILNANIIENTENMYLQEENNNLKKAINFEAPDNLEFITSKVKYRDIYNFLDEITIYKGSFSKIKEGMAVMNEKGLVGIVKKTENNNSIVRLVTNKNSNISVKINNTYGILKSQKNNLIVSNITNYDTVNIGDKIYTSGIGNIPGNIFIGTVKKIDLNNLEIEKIITVDVAVDFNDLNYLYVVGEV